MRSEKEMMALILSVAGDSDYVRVVGMEGSRTNIRAPKDEFQDYDITYLVTDMTPFLQDDSWLEVFGRRIIMQKPEAMSLFPPELGGWFSYLMLFEDGSRIDLKLAPVADLERYLGWDKLLTILLDKDGRVKEIPVPTDEDYRVKKPSPANFDDCCNEFWWTATYVAKGLCRGEHLYAAEHLERYVQASLLRMLAWRVGIETHFSISVGKSYKYLRAYLPDDRWYALLATYRADSADAIWESLYDCFRLFRQASGEVAKLLDYPYPDYDGNVTRYIEELRWRFTRPPEKIC